MSPFSWHSTSYSKCDTRKRGSKIDEYYDVIDYLLNQQDVQVFFYKRVLWQYLVDNHDLNCAQSSFRRWISQRNEFQSYFDGKTNRTVNGVKRDCKSKAYIITYQTGMGEEAQLDWLCKDSHNQSYAKLKVMRS